MMDEFEGSQSAHDGGFWDPASFDYMDWIQQNTLSEAGLEIPEGWVPAIQFVAFDQGQAVGFLNLRLGLNQALLEKGGHMGYSVRPSQRCKGYASQMVALGVKEARAKNIHRLLITCSVDNEASRKVILGAGGRLEDVRDRTERYWIEVGHE